MPSLNTQMWLMKSLFLLSKGPEKSVGWMFSSMKVGRNSCMGCKPQLWLASHTTISVQMDHTHSLRADNSDSGPRLVRRAKRGSRQWGTLAGTPAGPSGEPGLEGPEHSESPPLAVVIDQGIICREGRVSDWSGDPPKSPALDMILLGGPSPFLHLHFLDAYCTPSILNLTKNNCARTNSSPHTITPQMPKCHPN